MNSVISAFKTKKSSSSSGGGGGVAGGGGQTVTLSPTTTAATSPNITTCNNEKNHRSSNNNSNHSTPNGKKLNLSSQENGYQYLRHIREIDTATKMLSAVALTPDDLLEGASDKLNFRPPRMCVDVVDHASAIESPSLSLIIDNCNLGQQLNNCDTVVVSTSSPHRTGSSCTSTTTVTAEDDDESSASAACTSSSSEHSQSTVITSTAITQTQTTQTQMSSPAKSLSGSISYSSCSNSSSSCDITTIVDTPSTNTETTATANCTQNGSNNECNSSEDGDSSSSVGVVGVPTNQPAPTSNNITLPIIMPNENSSLGSCNGTQGASNSATTTPKSARYSKPRLSLSRFINHSMPSVHGRPNANGMNGNGTGANGTTTNGGQPKRLSTHQRNLSLDFRSMGILLPPVSQVTNTRINLTQHHRNRSLDSALQRIPEVEVSSPNAESENTFCTNSILGSTMCSKIVTSTVSSNSPISSTCIVDQSQQQCKLSSLTSSAALSSSASSRNSSVIVEPCSRTKLSENPNCNSKPPPIVLPLSKVAVAENNSNNNNNNNSKKREDLTSLGSDDSGIICGSESDQVSLNRIRQSHESLDSGEMDAEEECIEILDTTSMDEEYGMLQSDLCFYQSAEIDCQTLRPRKRHEDRTTPTSESNENRTSAQHLPNPSPSSPVVVSSDSGSDLAATPTSPLPEENNTPATGNKTAAQKPSETLESGANKSEHIRNEVLFKNFFGATKNAIFRTAQSIIENHEKKNAAKLKAGSGEDTTTPPTPDIKSPTEISKKKEFLRLISSNASKKAAAAAAIKINSPTESEAPQPLPIVTVTSVALATTTPTTESSDNITKPSLIKSGSISSLNRLKAVPGVVKCFVREKEPPREPTKTEKGPNGLLRFFESPVFNIHFAIHYLFYSKEPGVLSFIGNKIFSFPDQEVDLYIPQLIVMYIQMDELAEVLDPYLTIRCRKSVDFSLKCLWLLEAYNYQVDSNSPSSKKTQLALMKEIFSKKERKQLKVQQIVASPVKKTHHRSQSDATVLLSGSRLSAAKMPSLPFPSTPAKLCLGDLTSGRAFDNGCTCFESVRGTVNDLLGHKTVCMCGAPKSSPQKEFMKALINVGKNLTSLPSKAEKTSALRMFLNLINKNLPARVWLPLYSDIPHHVVRITEEKTAVLNSKDKTPYIIYVEVVEVNDIYSSPVILKMMPSLRHTKSEEHLESKDCCNSAGNLATGTAKTSESSAESHTGLDSLVHSCLDDVWSQEDDEITAQYLNMRKQLCERDSVSQMSLDSCDSRDQGNGIPALFNIGDVRTRHCNNLNCENTKSFSNDPEDPSAAALKEPWHEKEKQIRDSSPYGHLSNWRLLSAIVKCGDDLRQELMATQLLQMFKIIWDEENVELWVRPYKIVCLSNDSGLIEPILNTVSLHQIKKNSNKSLRDYFIDEYGAADGEKFRAAQKNFVQSCAAYCLISYLLQVKDRHNGNILLHSDGHLIHIDFGFILSISPKNLGFEQSPFKLTPEFVDVMDGTSSELWTEFNRLLLVGMMTARKHMDRIINFVEIMRSNAQLPCFKNGCSGTVQNLRKRFHMNLTEQEMERKVEQLVQDSLKSLSTKLYDGYQYYTNGIL